MLRKRLLIFFLALLPLVTSGSFCAAASADVIRQEHSALAKELQIPVCVWEDTRHKPKAIVLAIHGLTLHGTIYDTWARHLTQRGFVVAAPDLRGYGQWHKDKPAVAAAYDQSESDLASVAVALRRKYRNIPLIVAGESLGGSLALRLAANHADLVDGLILSAPALKHRYQVPLKTVANAALAVAYPRHKVDFSPYIKNYFSEDPAVGEEEINDPLVRKQLSLGEVMSSCRLISTTAECVDQIPGDMPVLVIQGGKDRMIQSASIKLLQQHLKATANVHMFPDRGHILLETAHIHADTEKTVTAWLDSHCVMRTFEGTQVAISTAH